MTLRSFDVQTGLCQRSEGSRACSSGGAEGGSANVVPPLPFSSRPVFTRSVPSPRDTQALPSTVPCSTLPRGGAP